MDKQRSTPVSSSPGNIDTADVDHDLNTSVENESSPDKSKSNLIEGFESPYVILSALVEGWTKWSIDHEHSRIARFLVERLHAGRNARYVVRFGHRSLFMQGSFMLLRFIHA